MQRLHICKVTTLKMKPSGTGMIKNMHECVIVLFVSRFILKHRLHFIQSVMLGCDSLSIFGGGVVEVAEAHQESNATHSVVIIKY